MLGTFDQRDFQAGGFEHRGVIRQFLPFGRRMSAHNVGIAEALRRLGAVKARRAESSPRFCDSKSRLFERIRDGQGRDCARRLIQRRRRSALITARSRPGRAAS